VIQSRATDLIRPAMLDFLRKWFIFGWAVRDLTRDIPSVWKRRPETAFQCVHSGFREIAYQWR
jgi:hypothetical protein